MCFIVFDNFIFEVLKIILFVLVWVFLGGVYVIIVFILFEILWGKGWLCDCIRMGVLFVFIIFLVIRFW